MQQLLLWQNHLSMDSQPLHCAKCNYTSNPSRKALAALHNSRETWLISSWLMCNISWLVFHREWLPLCNYSMHGGSKHPRKGRGKWHKRHITKWELTGKIVYVKEYKEYKVTLRVLWKHQGWWWLWCGLGPHDYMVNTQYMMYLDDQLLNTGIQMRSSFLWQWKCFVHQLYFPLN